MPEKLNRPSLSKVLTTFDAVENLDICIVNRRLDKMGLSLITFVDSIVGEILFFDEFFFGIESKIVTCLIHWTGINDWAAQS